jgi:hypothetical protein
MPRSKKHRKNLFTRKREDSRALEAEKKRQELEEDESLKDYYRKYLKPPTLRVSSSNRPLSRSSIFALAGMTALGVSFGKMFSGVESTGAISGVTNNDQYGYPGADAASIAGGFDPSIYESIPAVSEGPIFNPVVAETNEVIPMSLNDAVKAISRCSDYMGSTPEAKIECDEYMRNLGYTQDENGVIRKLAETQSATSTASLSTGYTYSVTTSPSSSVSPSQSGSVTITPSATFSASATKTTFYTESVTATFSPTPSVTPTISLTPSVSPTVTQTSSNSITNSFSPTESGTMSITESVSVTNTNTYSPSQTITGTSSETTTDSYSTSPSGSPTLTSSVTESASKSFSISGSTTSTTSKTNSVTYSPTPSPSGTPTAIATESVSVTNSLSASGSPTSSTTVTESASFTDSGTPTSSVSKTSSVSYSPSPSPSATPAVSATNSETTTISFSPSGTPTSSKNVAASESSTDSETTTVSSTTTTSFSKTPSPSGTPTPTASITNSKSATFSKSPDGSLTPTSSVSATTTVSYSPSGSPSQSVEQSQSKTLSATGSLAETASSSVTTDFSPSGTPTTQVSLSASTTYSPTSSESPSLTVSGTSSSSKTSSFSATGSLSDSLTRTLSRTLSNTGSITGSSLVSASNSYSTSPSGTPTLTGSVTKTIGETYSPTTSPSQAPTVSETFTSSATTTYSSSGTFSSTTIKSSSTTPSISESQSPSLSPSMSPSDSGNVTSTVTISYTPSGSVLITSLEATPSASTSTSFEIPAGAPGTGNDDLLKIVTPIAVVGFVAALVVAGVAIKTKCIRKQHPLARSKRNLDRVIERVETGVELAHIVEAREKKDAEAKARADEKAERKAQEIENRKTPEQKAEDRRKRLSDTISNAQRAVSSPTVSSPAVLRALQGYSSRGGAGSALLVKRMPPKDVEQGGHEGAAEGSTAILDTLPKQVGQSTLDIGIDAMPTNKGAAARSKYVDPGLNQFKKGAKRFVRNRGLADTVEDLPVVDPDYASDDEVGLLEPSTLDIGMDAMPHRRGAGASRTDKFSGLALDSLAIFNPRGAKRGERTRNGNSDSVPGTYDEDEEGLFYSDEDASKDKSANLDFEDLTEQEKAEVISVLQRKERLNRVRALATDKEKPKQLTKKTPLSEEEKKRLEAFKPGAISPFVNRSRDLVDIEEHPLGVVEGDDDIEDVSVPRVDASLWNMSNPMREAIREKSLDNNSREVDESLLEIYRGGDFKKPSLNQRQKERLRKVIQQVKDNAVEAALSKTMTGVDAYGINTNPMLTKSRPPVLDAPGINRNLVSSLEVYAASGIASIPADRSRPQKAGENVAIDIADAEPSTAEEAPSGLSGRFSSFVSRLFGRDKSAADKSTNPSLSSRTSDKSAVNRTSKLSARVAGQAWSGPAKLLYETSDDKTRRLEHKQQRTQLAAILRKEGKSSKQIKNAVKRLKETQKKQENNLAVAAPPVSDVVVDASENGGKWTQVRRGKKPASAAEIAAAADGRDDFMARREGRYSNVFSPELQKHLDTERASEGIVVGTNSLFASKFGAPAKPAAPTRGLSDAQLSLASGFHKAPTAIRSASRSILRKDYPQTSFLSAAGGVPPEASNHSTRRGSISSSVSAQGRSARVPLPSSEPAMAIVNPLQMTRGPAL